MLLSRVKNTAAFQQLSLLRKMRKSCNSDGLPRSLIQLARPIGVLPAFGVAYTRVPKSVIITAFSVLLRSSPIPLGQQAQGSAPQTGQPAQPSSSVYGRMRRIPSTQGQQTQSQQPTTQ